ncbi:MAG: helix-turn-helix domain-containing protein [Veillonella parvula]|jgi:helix-turn-helix domain of resolvase|nr:helix-turn-helix domain-containing protein [Veillonella parvula]MBS5751468.1 helix-turn-helix domain-containing protein [Veillonella parvula]MDU6126187.1 helix-turn-helix domain-containing protein [Veillonella sp.]
MNIRKLKAKLVEKDISIIQFANILGIDRSTVYRKLNKSGGEFYCKRC